MTQPNPITDPAKMTDRDLNSLVAEMIFEINLSAHNDLDIAEAVWSGFWSNDPMPDGSQIQKYLWGGMNVEIEISGSKWGYKKTHGNPGYGLWVWDHRKGETWQSAVEAHVKAWRRNVPAYSTDIAAAFTVVEKMLENGWGFYVFGPSPGDIPGPYWEANFQRHGDGGFYGFADSFPRAICLAAIAAGREGNK